MRRAVGVSGIGVVSAFGASLHAFRDALLNGCTGITPVAGFDTTGSRSTLAAEIGGFEASAWVAPMKLRRLDRTGAYAIAAAKLALDDAGRTLADDGDDAIGVVLGTWTAGGQSTQAFLEALFRLGPSGAPALLFDSTVANSAASIAALELKLRGANVTISQKEASGLAAIVNAVDLLRDGRARALLAGGVDGLFETFFKGHDGFGVMSAEQTFSRRLAPFDADRAGFVLGEGGFCLWLDASAGDPPRHGELLGVAASGTAVGVNRWPDDPGALARTMRLALDDAGVGPEQVDVVYASANGSVALDETEARALAALFGGGRPIITSIKGALGEFGAVGAASCAAALLCGAVRRVPPIAGLSTPGAAAAPLALAREAVDAPGPLALVNSFASGGALFSVVLRCADTA